MDTFTCLIWTVEWQFSTSSVIQLKRLVELWLNGCKLLYNLLQPPFKRCNWGHDPGGNMTLRSINSACNASRFGSRWCSSLEANPKQLQADKGERYCQHAWLIFQLNYFIRKFPDSLAMWQENASDMQKHAVDLLPWIPTLHDFLHVYPSQPNAILFHLKRDNHLDVLPRSVYHFIVGA